MFREPFPIHVEDVPHSVRFYCESFGFEEDFRWPQEGPAEFAFLRLGETGIGIATTAAPPLPDWPSGRDTGSFQLCIYAEDTEASSERLVSQGVKQVTAPREMKVSRRWRGQRQLRTSRRTTRSKRFSA